MLESLNKVIMMGRVATPPKKIPDEKAKLLGMSIDTSGILHHVVMSGDFCDEAVDMFEVGCGVYLEGRIASYTADDNTKPAVAYVQVGAIHKVADAPKPKKTTRKKKVAKKVAE